MSGDEEKRRFRWSLLALILVITAMVYWPSLDHEFQYDAKVKVFENPDLAEPLVFFKAFTEPEYNEKASRLIPNLTLCLDHRLYGWDPFGFHLTNLLIHLINVVLLAILARQLTIRCGLSSSLIPIVAAGFFALHPLNSEAVCYCNARPNLVATSFYLLTLVSLLRVTDTSGKKLSPAKRVGAWIGVVGALCCALLSKELAATVVVMAPLMIVLLEESRQRRQQILRRTWLVFAALATIGAVALISTRAYTEVTLNLFRYGEEKTGSWLLTLVLTLLGQGKVILHYFALALLPLPRFLNVDHYQEHLHHQFTGSAGAASTSLLIVPGAATLLLVMMVVVAFILRHRSRLVSFLLLWPLLTHAPTSLVPRAEAFVEYRTYLPMVGISILIGWFISQGRHLMRARSLPAVTGLLLMIALACGTVLRTRVWQTEISLWQDVLKKVPHNPRAHNNLGVALQAEGADDAALELYQQALELDPDYADAHSNLGHALALRGELEQAIFHLHKSLEIYPMSAGAHTNLGNALSAKGEYDEAIFHYLSALAYMPHLDDAHYNLGQVLIRQGKLADGITHFRLALQINPDNAEAHNTLGNALAIRGRMIEACSHFEQALRIRPDYAEAHRNLADVLLDQGRTEQAIQHYRRALAIKPELVDVPAKLNRAMEIRKQKRKQNE